MNIRVIILLFIVSQDSEAHTNIYGPSPKYVQQTANVVPQNGIYQQPITTIPVVVTQLVVVVPVITQNPQIPQQQIKYPQQNIQTQPYQLANPMQPQPQYPAPFLNQALYQQSPPVQQDNIYSKPNLLQPYEGYNSSDFCGQ